MLMKRLTIITKSSMHKEINGRMTTGACVVGYCLEELRLIRLTQGPEGAPLSGAVLQQFAVMDEIEVEITEETPAPPQNENALVQTESIRRLGRSRLGIREIGHAYIPGGSQRFMEDTRPVLDSVARYDHSVEIVCAENLTFVWRQGSKRPLASFSVDGRRHLSYRVTDPNLELTEPAEERREQILEAAYLVISIPSIPFAKDGLYYKFIASVFPVITNETIVSDDRTPEQVLEQYYGYPSFRPGQREIIDALLEGRDCICVMPTGRGKSVCYQIPAMLLRGTALVVSPLVSLMKDQVAALIRMGIPAAYLNSTQSPAEQHRTLREMAAGRYKLVYTSPERLSFPQFQQFCATLHLSLIAVDEAHCVSQWGPDFRYDYLNIDRFIRSLPGRPVIGAFTATATEAVAKDVCRHLELRDPLSIRTGFDRPNLYFGVLQPPERRTWVRQYLDEHRGSSGIIYCATRKTTEQLFAFLSGEGFSVGYYHAGLSTEERTKVQEDFAFDRTPVMIATNAFGMGIDKPNVSFVIHYNIPKSMEAYYQEAGRAGRDGAPADCILLYSRSDLITDRRLIGRNDPNPDLTREEAEQVRQAALQRLGRMADYAEGTACLRSFILHYFGEEPVREACGNCSNCKGEYELTNVLTEAKMILSCVARTGQRYGREFIVDVLKGKETAWNSRLGMKNQTTWGLMKACRISDIRRMIEALVSQEYLSYSGEEFPVLRLTAKSKELLFSDQPFMIRKIAGPRKKKAGQDKATVIPTDADHELYERLRLRRNETAAEENVPPYVILDNKTLMQIAAVRPLTTEAFLQVRGIGRIKAERYASLFIPIVREYLESKG